LSVEQLSEQERLAGLVKRFKGANLLIVGDSIADRFLYGAIGRVSREAPVFILRHEQTETVPGGAANCAMNLASLGANVSLVSVTGNDEAGTELLEKLHLAGVDVTGVVVSDKIQTTTKVRILAGHSHSNRQQVIRIDYEGQPHHDAELRAAIAERLDRALPEAQAVVLSDYNYGVVDAQVIALVREASHERSVPVLVDSRFRLSEFDGFTAATPNEDEVEQLLGTPIDSTEQLSSVAADLKRKLNYQALLVTRGGKGMMLLEDNSQPLQISAVGAHQPVDVTGAGDTVIATFALALASKATFADAARLANYAGGLVVMKRGTASVTAQELQQSVLNSEIE
jgi:rfaE bifunctional protein kinase chain/domain